MAVEAKRGCGYRVVGGLYLVCDGKGRACGRFPIELKACPTCGGGVRQSRGWTWIEPANLFAETDCFRNLYNCDVCPLSDLSSTQYTGLERSGLIWIGKAHYPTPDHFDLEAETMGISRRISAVPKGFVVGRTWVFLAHPEAVSGFGEGGEQVMLPAVVKAFRPTAIEKIVTETQAQDEEEMDKLKRRGITPFAVPDSDPDHAADKGDDE